VISAHDGGIYGAGTDQSADPEPGVQERTVGPAARERRPRVCKWLDRAVTVAEVVLPLVVGGDPRLPLGFAGGRFYQKCWPTTQPRLASGNMNQ